MARTVILGTGGHAKVLAATIAAADYLGVEMFGIDDEADIRMSDRLIVGIGMGVDCGIPRDRMAAFLRFQRTHHFFSVYHGNACFSKSAKNGRGCDIGAFAYVGPDAVLGDNILVNTGAHVSHDCVIGDHTVIAPGAILCGEVKLGRACAVGAGAIVIQGVELADETRIPAGTLVVGPDDFRKPVRMVRHGGADTLAVSKVEIDPVDGEFILQHALLGPLNKRPDPDL